MDHAEKINVCIKENAVLARMASSFLKEEKMAVVIGKTIYLYRATTGEFLADRSWLRHELMHVWQYRKRGIFLFLFKYLYESIVRGYYNNRYEIEARNAEEFDGLEENFHIIKK